MYPFYFCQIDPLGNLKSHFMNIYQAFIINPENQQSNTAI